MGSLDSQTDLGQSSCLEKYQEGWVFLLVSLYLGARRGFRCCSVCHSKASSNSYWTELASHAYTYA